MKAKLISALCTAAALVLFIGPGPLATAQTDAGSGDARTIVTILPKKGNEAVPSVTAANVAVKIDGKDAGVAGLSHYGAGSTNLQIVLLVDDGARSSLALYLKEMAAFLNSLPPNAAVCVAYIDNGSPRIVAPFTTDHAAAAKALRIPISVPGVNADPYFALTELVDKWPSAQSGMRHEIVMISDGVDPYYGLRYDPDDPYVVKAQSEAQKHGVVVYSIYYKDRGRADRLGIAINSGQNYLIQLSEATGGELYYTGFDNPVSFAPFFDQISRNLQSQYELGLHVPPKVKDGLQNLKVKINAPNSKSSSASAIFVGEPSEQSR